MSKLINTTKTSLAQAAALALAAAFVFGLSATADAATPPPSHIPAPQTPTNEVEQMTSQFSALALPPTPSLSSPAIAPKPPTAPRHAPERHAFPVFTKEGLDPESLSFDAKRSRLLVGTTGRNSWGNAGFDRLVSIDLVSGTRTVLVGGELCCLSVTHNLLHGTDAQKAQAGRDARNLRLRQICDTATDEEGNIFIVARSEEPRNIILKRRPDGSVTHIAGLPTDHAALNGDYHADARRAAICPSYITVGPDGKLFVADRSYKRIYMLEPVANSQDQYSLTTIAGSQTIQAHCADRDDAREACVEPCGIVATWDRTNPGRRDLKVYFSDAHIPIVRLLSPAGDGRFSVKRVVGFPGHMTFDVTVAHIDRQDARNAFLPGPGRLTAGPNGKLYVATSLCVAELTPTGEVDRFSSRRITADNRRTPTVRAISPARSWAAISDFIAATPNDGLFMATWEGVFYIGQAKTDPDFAALFQEGSDAWDAAETARKSGQSSAGHLERLCFVVHSLNFFSGTSKRRQLAQIRMSMRKPRKGEKVDSKAERFRELLEARGIGFDFDDENLGLGRDHSAIADHIASFLGIFPEAIGKPDDPLKLKADAEHERIRLLGCVENALCATSVLRALNKHCSGKLPQFTCPYSRSNLSSLSTSSSSLSSSSSGESKADEKKGTQ